jgi:hypothetical protein
MLEKDPNRFKKIRADKDKHDQAAASNRADAEAEYDSEDLADDDEQGHDSRNTPTKTVATKKPAPKTRATALRRCGTTTPAPPTIQGGRLTKAIVADMIEKQGRREHRPVDYGYRSAPSDSEHTEIRKLTHKTKRKPETVVKLRETINRHARYCPFVRLNKKLHHAHRRIRYLQGRWTDEPEISSDSEGNAGNGNGNGSAIEVGDANGNGNGKDPVQQEDSNGEDGDDAEQQDVVGAGKSTVPPKKKAASKAKVTTAKKTTRTTKKSTKPALPEQPTQSDDDERLSEQDPPSDKEGSATAGATNKDAPTSKATDPSDEALSKTPRAHSSLSGSEVVVPDKNDVNHKGNGLATPPTTPEDGTLQRQLIRPEHAVQKPSVKPATTTKAGTTEKRKVSDTELTSEDEHNSKNRKTRAD